jgi:hypothetical protein
MGEGRQKQRVRVVGVLFSVVVTSGFVWAGFQWYNGLNWPPQLGLADMQANEVKTFRNVRLIGEAQQKYKGKDWDGDGQKSYASFLVHLWTSIDMEGEPVLAGLIPKRVGFAMGRSEAVDGYYFVNLHERELAQRGQRARLDHEREWAITGVPAVSGKTGFLVFLADGSGQIHAKSSREIPSRYPHDPLSDGWTRIESVQGLKDFQRTVDYNRRTARRDSGLRRR